MFESDPEPPKFGPADIAVFGGTLIAKIIAACTLDPVTATGAMQVIDSVFRSPYDKRRLEAMEDLLLVLHEAVKRVPDLTEEDIEKHQAFVTASIRAAQISFNTHEQEKREYLRTALLNVLLTTTADETRQQIFFNAIDAFAASHVKALQVLAGRAKVPWSGSLSGRTILGAMEATMPKMANQGPLIDAILSDLTNRGFAMVSKSSLPFQPGATNVTNLGLEFLRFVCDPPASA